MNEALSQALRRAATELDAATPPPQVLPAVLARWQAPAGCAACGGPRHARGAASGPAAMRPQLWAWPGAAVALVLVASVLLLLRSPAPEPPGADEGRFVNLVPPERWPREDSAAWLVRTELTGDRLAALGLPFDPARAGQPVHAEMLMRPTGEVLAVRFVP
jgi:hypothetical protein